MERSLKDLIEQEMDEARRGWKSYQRMLKRSEHSDKIIVRMSPPSETNNEFWIESRTLLECGIKEEAIGEAIPRVLESLSFSLVEKTKYLHLYRKRNFYAGAAPLEPSRFFIGYPYEFGYRKWVTNQSLRRINPG